MGRALREERGRALRDADERRGGTRLGQRRGVYHHDLERSDRDNRGEETMTNAVMGLVTCSSRTEARKVARTILKKKLGACVNIIGGLESHYWWRGKLETARECLLLIKTTRARVSSVVNAVKAAHSYEVSEVIFLLQVSDAVEALERAHTVLKDENSVVRWSAVTALQTSGRAEAIPWLVEVEKSDSTESAGEAATEALGKL